MGTETIDQIPPYGLVHNWLGLGTVERLLAYAQSNEHLFKESKVGDWDTDRIDHTRRRSRKMRALGDFAAQIEDKIRDILPAIFNRLGNTPFAPTEFELEIVAHGDGAFYARHIDTFTQSQGITNHRVVSAVYYFHAQPKAFSGGALRLHSLAAGGQQGSFVDIEPNNDTFVFFPSWFPHEVLSVNCPSNRFIDSRFAINCWILR